MLKLGVILIPALMIAAAFSACGGGDKKTIDIPGGGKAEVSTNGKIPSGFPDDFPVYDGAKVQTSFKGSQGGQSGFFVTWETDDSVEKVADFYKDKFSSGPWKSSGEYESNGSSVLTAENASAKQSAAVTISDADGKTQISSYLGDDPNASSDSSDSSSDNDSSSGDSLTSDDKTSTAEAEDEESSGPEKTSTPSPLPDEVTLSKDFPTDKVPLPSDARVTSNSSFGSGGQKTYIITYFTKDDPEKASQYFVDEMPKHGWSSAFTSNSDGEYFVTFTGADNGSGGNDGLTVNAIESTSTPGYTEVSLSVSMTTTGG